MRPFVLAACCLALPLAAAAQKKPAAKPAGTRPAAGKAGPDLPSKVPAGVAVATVNGEPIPLSLYLDRLSLRFGPEVRETLIQEALIRRAAKERKITATAAEIDKVVARTFDQTAQQYGDPEKLAEELKRTRGWTPADYREVIRMQADVQVLREKLANSLVKADAVKDADVGKRYEEARETAFTERDSVRISHVMIRRPGGEDMAKDEDARMRAEAILRRLQGGARFEDVAKEASEDKISGAQGGQVPIDVQRGSNPFGAAFEAVVFNAPMGLVGEVVPTPLGYHVVRVDSKKAGRVLPLAEVQDRIRAALLAERREQALEELFVRQRATAKINTGKF